MGLSENKRYLWDFFISRAVQRALLEFHISEYWPYLPEVLTVIVLSCQIWSGLPFLPLLSVTCHLCFLIITVSLNCLKIITLSPWTSSSMYKYVKDLAPVDHTVGFRCYKKKNKMYKVFKMFTALLQVLPWLTLEPSKGCLRSPPSVMTVIWHSLVIIIINTFGRLA